MNNRVRAFSGLTTCLFTLFGLGYMIFNFLLMLFCILEWIPGSARDSEMGVAVVGVLNVIGEADAETTWFNTLRVC